MKQRSFHCKRIKFLALINNPGRFSGTIFFIQTNIIMNDNQINRLRMYRKVKGVFADNKEIAAQYPPIGKSYGVFDDLLTQIEEIGAAGARTTSGTFESKLELKDAIAREAVELASAAFAYAKDQGDTELAAVLDVSYSDIRYGDDQATYNLAMAVYNELKGLVAELEDYMVTAEDLSVLKDAIDTYQTNLESTQGQNSVARTRQLAGLFKKASDHLSDHLDKLVSRIARKEPVFFDTYTNARVILDLGGRRKVETPEVFE